MLKATGVDHWVVNVSDAERSLTWYCEKLGLEPLRVDEWRRGEIFFPSLRVNDTTVVDLLPWERSGENVNHVCLVVEPTDLEAVAASGEFDVVEGPAQRWGAQGDATALYVRDPDGNTVELRHYG